MIEQLFWFSVAVLPLVIIPGPDMLLCIAQGLSSGRSGVWRSVNGITLGYLAHALLAAAGLATLVVTSPKLFEMLRWIGIFYIAWLSVRMLHSAIRPTSQRSMPDAQPPSPQLSNKEIHQKQAVITAPQPIPISLWRGFLTSFLNPKGLFVYLTIVPQFIDPERNAAAQALALSLTNAALCYIVYAVVGLTAAQSNRTGLTSPGRMRIAEGIGGILLGGATVIITIN